MPDEEKIRLYVDEVREAIRLDLAKLASRHVVSDARKEIRHHLLKCHSTLKQLKNRLQAGTQNSDESRP